MTRQTAMDYDRESAGRKERRLSVPRGIERRVREDLTTERDVLF